MRINTKHCSHNQKCRYTHGFYCEECGTFFPKESATYRSGEYLSSLWMVLHNINAGSLQSGGEGVPEVIEMRDKIGIGKSYANYEDLIKEAEAMLAKYGKNVDSATRIIF